MRDSAAQAHAIRTINLSAMPTTIERHHNHSCCIPISTRMYTCMYIHFQALACTNIPLVMEALKKPCPPRLAPCNEHHLHGTTPFAVENRETNRSKPNQQALNTFDAFISNGYVDAPAVGKELQSLGFKNKLYTLDRWAKNVYADKPTHQILQKAHAHAATWKMIGGVNVTSLNLWLRPLLHSRGDAKASVYPRLLENRTACQIDLHQPFDPCVGDWHVCRPGAIWTRDGKRWEEKCIEEGHFCMPGPLSVVTRYLFGVLTEAD